MRLRALQYFLAKGQEISFLCAFRIDGLNIGALIASALNGELDRGEYVSVCCLTVNAAVDTDFQPIFAPGLSGDNDSGNLTKECGHEKYP